MDASSSEGLAGNQTDAGGGGGEPETGGETPALKVFNVTLMSLVAVIFIIAAIACARAWHKYSRQYRRAREYETSVRTSSSTSPATSSMRRIIGIHKSIVLMRKQENHNPQVYFIYSNLAMAEDDEEGKPPADIVPPIPGDVKSSGVILNPRVFYV